MGLGEGDGADAGMRAGVPWRVSRAPAGDRPLSRQAERRSVEARRQAAERVRRTAMRLLCAGTRVGAGASTEQPCAQTTASSSPSPSDDHRPPARHAFEAVCAPGSIIIFTSSILRVSCDVTGADEGAGKTCAGADARSPTRARGVTDEGAHSRCTRHLSADVAPRLVAGGQGGGTT